MHRFRSYSIFVRTLVVFGLTCAAVTTTYPVFADGNKYSFSLFLGGTAIDQSSVSSALFAGGYRSTDHPGRLPDSSSSLYENSFVGITYPGVSFEGGFGFSARLGLRLGYSFTDRSKAFYANHRSSDPSYDQLSWEARNSSSRLLMNYVLIPRTGKHTFGFQLDLSGGCSLDRLKEHLEVRLPSGDSLSPSFTSKEQLLRRTGVSALFALDASVFIGRHFSITPVRLLWSLSALQPSFREADFDNGTSRRVVPARNYDLTCVVWQAGFSYRF